MFVKSWFVGTLTNRGFTSSTLRIVGTIQEIQKRIIVQSDLCIKLLFYNYHQNLNPILA
ncbi:hypothetical protein G436_2725 [Leptospira interrogans serovar Hardjo str. Norma]|uniref:Uncharacterized protein n=1 Tax=Leptospira interrogans serovar Hardjo str. Norma TaxID=1279460 RepID=A0A0M3TLY2_LEPIR|nr:hypothetical protein G436_2725 [Leptospira interrogans serovar Hardjo str. Norma]